eukprot:scaffold1883_cov396-Prasinococcus_capsulatus_cf.AAC.23
MHGEQKSADKQVRPARVARDPKVLHVGQVQDGKTRGASYPQWLAKARNPLDSTSASYAGPRPLVGPTPSSTRAGGHTGRPLLSVQVVLVRPCVQCAHRWGGFCRARHTPMSNHSVGLRPALLRVPRTDCAPCGVRACRGRPASRG